MAAELIIAPEAQQDVDEAYSWYEDRRPGLGNLKSQFDITSKKNSTDAGVYILQTCIKFSKRH